MNGRLTRQSSRYSYGVWFKRQDDERKRELSPILIDVLRGLDSDCLLLAPGEVPVYISDGIERLNILREDRINSPELIALARVVRRTQKVQTGQIAIPRGPIGEGLHELTLKMIPIAEGRYVLAIISDETEIQRVNEVRRDFVANVSHELKTPIGALSLLSEAVLAAKDEPEAVEKFAKRMSIESKRLTDLVQEIINLSRLQDSDPLQEAFPMGVNDLIAEAVDQCRTVADSRNIGIEFLPGPDITILGDREQLIMAIHNLIENAINYSPENTKVAVTSRIKDGIVEISITDQGIGIPEDDLARIFERFYRVDPARSRQTGGTGLGLSIVKHVAAKHGGDIKVWSAENVGSTFTLMLPLYTGASEKTL